MKENKDWIDKILDKKLRKIIRTNNTKIRILIKEKEKLNKQYKNGKVEKDYYESISLGYSVEQGLYKRFNSQLEEILEG